jgi:hypothetical protein
LKKSLLYALIVFLKSLINVKEKHLLLLLLGLSVILFSCNSNSPGASEIAVASKTSDSHSSNIQSSKENIDEDQTLFPSVFENNSILVVPNVEFHGDGREEIENKE